MFLRNYDNCLAAFHLISKLYIASSSSTLSYGNTLEFADGYCNQKATNGSKHPIYVISSTGSSYAHYHHLLMCLNVNGICLGNGTNEVTYDDFKLSGDVVENKLIEVSIVASYDKETSKWKKTLIATYNNSSDTDITITEWGLWRSNSSNSKIESSYGNSSDICVLVFREVLDEPIVIEAGTTATLTFSIDIPMPNHP